MRSVLQSKASFRSHLVRHTRSLIQCVIPPLLLAVLGAGPVDAQPSAVGRWGGASPSALSSNSGVTATGIHLIWMRGDPDWAPGSTTRYHSYLFWWNNRAEFCITPSAPENENPKFRGALYGWRPGSNPTPVLPSRAQLLLLLRKFLKPSSFLGGHSF